MSDSWDLPKVTHASERLVTVTADLRSGFTDHLTRRQLPSTSHRAMDGILVRGQTTWRPLQHRSVALLGVFQRLVVAEGKYLAVFLPRQAGRVTRLVQTSVEDHLVGSRQGQQGCTDNILELGSYEVQSRSDGG